MWGQKAERVAEWLFERNAVHILSTDAHDTKRRTPSLSVARDKIGKLYGHDVAKALVDDNPRAVINDRPLPYFPNPQM
jgi:protein-tyrosine phosphatase